MIENKDIAKKIEELESKIEESYINLKQFHTNMEDPGFHVCSYSKAIEKIAISHQENSRGILHYSYFLCEENGDIKKELLENKEALFESMAMFFINYNNRFFGDLSKIASELIDERNKNEKLFTDFVKNFEKMVTQLNKIKLSFAMKDSLGFQNENI